MRCSRFVLSPPAPFAPAALCSLPSACPDSYPLLSLPLSGAPCAPTHYPVAREAHSHCPARPFTIPLRSRLPRWPPSPCTSRTRAPSFSAKPLHECMSNQRDFVTKCDVLGGTVLGGAWEGRSALLDRPCTSTSRLLNVRQHADRRSLSACLVVLPLLIRSLLATGRVAGRHEGTCGGLSGASACRGCG